MLKEISKFNNPENTDENGILCFGGTLKAETLIAAYQNGIFPWPIPGLPLAWFCPHERGVLFFKDFHIPRSLEKAYRKNVFTYSVDKNFFDVIKACAFTKRPHQPGTWITPEIVRAYTQMHRLGYAHSIEVWNKDQILVGGLYGLCISGCFAAESMFFKEDNASKCALIYLVEHLKKRGATWIDIQVMTPHMEKLGAKPMDRRSFLDLLYETQKKDLKLF